MSNLGRAACVLVLACICACGGSNAGSGDGGPSAIDSSRSDATDAPSDGPRVATLVALQISPPTASAALGTTQTFTALGIFSDASQRDVSASVTWSTTPAGIATISNDAATIGTATAITIGTASVVATDAASGVTNSAQLSAIPATLTALAITPSTVTVSTGATQQFTATGTYSDHTQEDLTASVQWTVTSGTATIQNPPQLAGFASTHGVSTSGISARDPVSGLVATATLDATAATLVSIAVTPTDVAFAIGATKQYTATGTFSDSHTADVTQTVTWSSSASHATISNVAGTNGLATGVTAGDTTIKALDPTTAVFGTTTATVVSGPPALSAFGPAGQFTSVGHARGATFPQALAVSIAAPAALDTVVTLTATASISLTSTTVTIPAGQTSAVVSLTGVTKDPAATLTATTGTGATLSQTVRVIDYSQETPALAKLSPSTVTLAGGESQVFTLSFDLPVQNNTSTTLSTTNAADYATAPPASVTVLANQLSATFSATAAAAASGTSVITAGTLQATVTFSGATACTPSQIVISQVYGGGGNTGSVFKNDFIELFNRGTTAVDLSGWSVWIASTTGTFTQQTVIAAGQSIAPNHYYLIGEAAGTAGTTALPVPDTTGTLAIAAGGGKVVLVGPGTITSGQTCPSATNVDDLFGSTGANCFEGTVGPAGSATNALIRADGGCTDTNDNATDFAAAAADPRNSGSAAHTCPVSCGE